ncbi:MAG: hypothetical protein MRZ79_23520 [Bacteroidia bacterium]|nr:hypothetical protein [Bacteroidia bacterium]
MTRTAFWLILVLIFSSISELSAQKIGARLDIGRREPKPDFIEYSPKDNGLVTLGPYSKASNRFLAITKYNSTFRKEWTKEVIQQNGRKNVDFMTVLGENILVFVSEFFPREKVIKTYYYRYSLEGEVLEKEAILSIYPNQKEQKVDLQYVLSPNKRRLLCYKNLQNRKEAEKVLYYLFSEEGASIANGELTLKYPDNRFRVTNIRVSNQGNVFVLGKFSERGWVTDPNNFVYLAYRYDTQINEGREFEIDLGDRIIADMTFRIDRDENLYLAGFYSNRGADQMAGTYLQKINWMGIVEKEATAPFSQDFLRNYLSKGQINRGKEIRDFYIRPEDGIILRSDGGVLLIAEKFYIVYQTYRDQFGYLVDREIYHYDDVILTSISPDGDIEWQSVVEKRQASDQPANLSFFNASSAMGTYIFYEYKPRRANLNVYNQLVDIEGNVGPRVPLIPDYKYGDFYYPRYSVQTGNDEALLVYLRKRGKIYTVLKVKFEE